MAVELMTCAAYPVGDQMACPCGLAWDRVDPDPPRCRRQRHVEPGRRPPAIVSRALEDERRASAIAPPELARMPPELPIDVALEMATAASVAHANETRRSPNAKQIAAMRAAYRVLLDRLGE